MLRLAVSEIASSWYPLPGIAWSWSAKALTSSIAPPVTAVAPSAANVASASVVSSVFTRAPARSAAWSIVRPTPMILRKGPGMALIPTTPSTPRSASIAYGMDASKTACCSS